MSDTERRAHWDDRYRSIGSESVSWFEAEPRLSLDLIDLGGATAQSSVIDIGGGASVLTARLQQRGFDDLSVLDISAAALDTSKSFVERPEDVNWICADIVNWSPTRRWRVWHDRAVFHFLTDPAERRTYRELLVRTVEPGGSVVISTFSDSGPTTCSGLPVERYSPDGLLAELGHGFTEIARGTIDHVTPGGGIQPFAWIVARASEA